MMEPGEPPLPRTALEEQEAGISSETTPLASENLKVSGSTKLAKSLSTSPEGRSSLKTIDLGVPLEPDAKGVKSQLPIGVTSRRRLVSTFSSGSNSDVRSDTPLNQRAVRRNLLVRQCVGLVIFLCVLGVAIGCIAISRFLTHKGQTITLDPQKSVGQAFASLVSGETLKEYFLRYTAAPRLAGSSQDEEAALYTRDKILEFGFEPDQVQVAEYEVMLNSMKEMKLEIVAPEQKKYRAEFLQPVEGGDGKQTEKQQAFHYYSADGEVKDKELVFANYGRREDFEALKKLDVDVKDRVVIMRNGDSSAANKVLLAQEYGAVAAIIYPDPLDDGFSKGVTFPEGPWRPSLSAVAESVFLGQADPTKLWPASGALPSGGRLELKDAKDRTKTGTGFALPAIPSIPINYHDAEPLLRSLEGKEAKEVDPAWRGGFNFTYHVGPGPGRVNLVNRVSFEVKKIRNVIAKIPGEWYPDQVVIIGNQRDSLSGAADPGSGSSVLLEMARIFGKLKKGGWIPKRTILLASWDGGAYGALGQSEWIKKHQVALEGRAVAYINVDRVVAGQGPLQASVSQSLVDLVYEVARLVPQPMANVLQSTLAKEGQKDDKGRRSVKSAPVTQAAQDSPGDTMAAGASVYDVWLHATPAAKPSFSPKKEEATILAIGSRGSFPPLLSHSAVASLDLGFEGGYFGVSGSVQDNRAWVLQFSDNHGLEYHKRATELLGHIVISLSDNPLLPFGFFRYANKLKVEAEAVVAAIQKDNKWEKEKETLNASFSSLLAAIESFRNAATSFHRGAEELRASIATDGTVALSGAVRSVNHRILTLERQFLLPNGLPSRPWYRYGLLAPDRDNNKNMVSFPFIAEAAQGESIEELKGSIQTTAELIGRAAEQLMDKI